MAPLGQSGEAGGKNAVARRRWPGGWIHTQKDGRDLFIIERRVNGKRFSISTRCHSLKPAMKQLERFEADPSGYRPDGAPPPAGLVLDAKLAGEFHEWQLGKGNTRRHANEMHNRVLDWMKVFNGADLKKLTLKDDIDPALAKWKTSRSHRIIALKVFFSWLRKTRHLLKNSEDPTLDLPVPQAVPEKRTRRKAVETERVQAVLLELAPEYRDMLAVLAATGWHFSELERFIRNADSSIELVRRGDTIAVLKVRHKSKESHSTSIKNESVLEAAVRLRARGTVPRRPWQTLKAACKAAGATGFGYGVMRHTVATWLEENGATIQQIATFLGHKDPRTTKRYYADAAVPVVPAPLPQLRLVKG